MKADQLSKTAAFVAIKFYGLTREKQFRTLFDNSVIEFYDQLVHSLPAPLSWYHYWLQYKWARRFYIRSEEILLPGDLLHIIARKWYIQRVIRQLVDDGFRQLLILGAGFDHLGYYFSQEGLACIEIDAPKMAKLKRHFLEEYYTDQSHPHIIPYHFSSSKPIPQFTNHSKIDREQKTIVVAEGFFDYLSTDSVNKSLEQICNNFSHKTALITTHFSLDELSFFHRKVFKMSVRTVGEKLRFNCSADAFRRMLGDQGYYISQCFDSQTIRDNFHHQIDTKLPVLKGFYILSAKTKTGAE